MSESTGTAALVPFEPGAIAAPAMTAEAFGQRFIEYRQIQSQIDRALPDALVTIGDRQYRKKPYWRALALAFDLAVELVEERREVFDTFADGRENFGHLVIYRASSRTRSVIGDGACFAVEKAGAFRCPHEVPGRANYVEHFPAVTCPDYDPGYRFEYLPEQATEHNVRGHAHTRAFNRAIANLVAFGEVSAEEVEAESEYGAPPPRASRAPTPRSAASGVITEAQQRRMFAIAKTHGWNPAEVKAFLLKKHQIAHSNEVPSDRYDAICKTLEQGLDGDDK
jgi:hypothetical protein